MSSYDRIYKGQRQQWVGRRCRIITPTKLWGKFGIVIEFEDKFKMMATMHDVLRLKEKK